MTNMEIFEHNISSIFNLKATFSKVFVMCFECCGQILLAIFHLIYSFIFILKREFNIVYNRSILSQRKSSELLRNLKQEVLSLEKVPSHMVFNLGPETVSYLDIGKIIEWCFPAGIAHISFYSYNNDIDPNLIFKHVVKNYHSFVPRLKWGKSFNEEIKQYSEKRRNGFKLGGGSEVVTVHVYKREDGLDGLVEVVKELRREGVARVELESLRSRLSSRISAPDPDFIVVCGKDLSPFGLLPWHLRTSQFSLLDSHYHFTPEKFLQLLREYSNCQQRYGK